MDTKRNFRFIFTLVILIIMLFLLVINLVRRHSLSSSYLREYPLVTLETELNGVITEVAEDDMNNFRYNPYGARITINKNMKVTLLGEDKSQKNVYLHNVLKINDVIIKKKGSILILIKKIDVTDTVIYKFGLLDYKLYSVKGRE
jgi:hypothetical protein